MGAYPYPFWAIEPEQKHDDRPTVEYEKTLALLRKAAVALGYRGTWDDPFAAARRAQDTLAEIDQYLKTIDNCETCGAERAHWNHNAGNRSHHVFLGPAAVERAEDLGSSAADISEEMRRSLREAAQEIETLRAQAAQFQNERNALQAKVYDLESEREKLRADYADLSSRNVERGQELANIREQLTAAYNTTTVLRVDNKDAITVLARVVRGLKFNTYITLDDLSRLSELASR